MTRRSSGSDVALGLPPGCYSVAPAPSLGTEVTDGHPGPTRTPPKKRQKTTAEIK